MTSTPSGPTPSDRELLSAYLSDDLDEETASALEERLAAEPALAAELDHLAEMLAGLQGLSEVPAPSGYEERLRDRLAHERARLAGTDSGPAEAAADGAAEVGDDAADDAAQAAGDDAGDGAAVTALDAVRRRRWAAVSAVAAALLLGALVSAGVVGTWPFGASEQLALDGPGEGDTEAAEEFRSEGRGDRAAGEDERDRAAAEDEALDEPEPHAAPAPGDQVADPGPVVLDREVRLRDEAAVRRRHDDLPEAVALLGRSLSEAGETARAHRAAIADAPRFRSGTHPGACLGELTDAGGDRPRVPARVESVVYAGDPVLAYVVVEASPRAVELDRVVSLLFRPASCERLDAVVVEPAP